MKSREEIIETVKAAGIIGAGGGGFPSYEKLKTRVDIIIANGSECEPLLNSDKTLLREYPYKIIEGLDYAMQATGAKTGYITVKKEYKDIATIIKKAIPKGKNIKLHLQDNYYPAGDEFLTVYDVTGKIIPEGGLPLQVGVIVNNVLSLAQIYDALNGKVVTERLITLTGSVVSPQVVTVPIGATYRDLLSLAGGKLNSTDVLIDGGPMMGQIIKDYDMGISKTTSGLIVLPEDHIIINMQSLSISKMTKKSKAACCQCFRCTDLCPRNLIGHKIFPHKTMRTIDYNLSEPTEHITSAFLCSQCGICELIACDTMQLSPRKIYAEYRKLLVSRGVKNPHTNSELSALPELEYRKVPMSLLLKKLDLLKYSLPTPYTGNKTFDKVRISLNRHIGSQAIANIMVGEMVKIGDVIAMSPHDTPGTLYHSSIKGIITDINEEWIEIEKGAMDR